MPHLLSQQQHQLQLASHFVGGVNFLKKKKLGVALAPTSTLNEVTLGEASG